MIFSDHTSSTDSYDPMAVEASMRQDTSRIDGPMLSVAQAVASSSPASKKDSPRSRSYKNYDDASVESYDPSSGAGAGASLCRLQRR